MNALLKISKVLLIVIAIPVTTLVAYLGYCWFSAPDYKVAGVPILNYHMVNDKVFSPLAMTTKDFDRQMKYLHDNGYHTITLDELYGYIHDGKALPDKPILITFDDGSVDNYTNAWPILKKYGMKATLFMIADSIGAPRFVNAEQLREMNAGGFDVQSHTYSHKDMRKLTYAQVQTELTKSKTILSTLLHKPINYIAYPCGFTNSTVEAETKAAGYRLAVIVTAGNASPDKNPYALPRLAVFEGDNPFLNFYMRLHFAEPVRFLWALRDNLRDSGHQTLAAMVPLF